MEGKHNECEGTEGEGREREGKAMKRRKKGKQHKSGHTRKAVRAIEKHRKEKL